MKAGQLRQQWMPIFILLLTSIAVALLAVSIAKVCAADETITGEVNDKSLAELNKELSNPVSAVWAISFQQNNYKVSTVSGHGDEWNSNLNFQPVMPVSLTRDWILITRPVITLFNSTPFPKVREDPFTHRPDVDIDRTTALGDTVWMEMLSPGPALAGKWLFGIGPTFIFPTAASDFTGQGKWQIGPAAVFGYLSEKYIIGIFVQNWTSFAGNRDRSDTNSMNLQPIATYFLPGSWSIGYSGNILANWKADPGDVWTVPIGVGVGKVVRLGILPVKFSLAAQWMPVHPDDFGQKWNIQVSISPVIPKLIEGVLID
jgi:hypothetical protein